MNKLKQNLKVGLASLLLVGATVAAQAQTIWSDMGSEWGEPAALAFDGTKSTTWSQKSKTGWIGGEYPVGVKYNTVVITSAVDGFNDPNSGVPLNQNPRSFKDWVLKASNDTLAGWTTLDTRTGELFINTAAVPTRVTNPAYTFANEVAYKYYRFYFTNNGNQYTQMGELAFSYDPNAVIVPVPETDMFWSDMGSEWGEPAALAFDGTKSTTWSQKSKTGWIGGKYAIPVKYNTVVITSAVDGFNDPNSGVPLNQNPRTFKDWVLKGSNDTLAGWITLDTRAGELFINAAAVPTRVSRTFSFTNEVAYKYYRFYFTNNSNAYTQMGELAFSYQTDMFWSDMGSEWGEPAALAFDGLKSTTWSQKSKTGWIGGKYVEPKKYNTVEITTTGDGFNDANSGVPLDESPRVFKDWVLKGSNDTLAGWVTLDTRTGELFKKLPAQSRVSRTFSFTNEVAYKYYRFYFTNNSNAYSQMGELAFSYQTDMFWSDMGSEWGEPAPRAFDTFKSSGWSQKSKTGWIGGKYAVPVKYNTVAISTNADGFNDPNSGVPLDETPRAFKDWVLKGSNDTLAGWVDLDTRAGELFKLVAPATRVTKTYTFANTVAYKYYRFYFTNNSNDYTQMGELALSYDPLLPLTSLVLSGTETNGGARLVWNTTGEVGVKSFEILKKNAAGAFVSIGKKASKGNGDNTYSFFDANASTGDNYYQVKNIDLNGGSSASNVVNVKVSSLTNATSIYPNPTINGLVNVVAGGAVESVSIYSVSNGIKFISKKFNGSSKSVQIDVQSLAKGVYIVEVTSKLSVTRKKLIVN